MAGRNKRYLPSKPENSHLATVKNKMGLFEGVNKGTYLQFACNCLLTILLSSVEREHAFSTAGLLCSKIGSSMSDDMLDELAFLHAYYKVLCKETKKSE